MIQKASTFAAAAIGALVAALVLAPSTARAQEPVKAFDPTPTHAPSPLSRSIASAIAALPQIAADQEPNRVSDWSRVQALQRGIEITLAVKASPPAQVQLLTATDSAVFVLKPGSPDLSGRVKGALIRIGDQWPSIFNGNMTYSETKGVRVAQDGIFDGTRKVANLSQVVQRTAREDISEIRGPGRRKGNKLLAGVGAAGGLLVGLQIGIGIGLKDCGFDCLDEKLLVGAAVIGLPVALGPLGYYGGGHTVPGVIYRAPQSAEETQQ